MRGLACGLGLLVLGLGSGCGTAKGGGDAARVEPSASALQKSDAQARMLSQLAPRLEQKSAALTEVTRADGGRSLRVNGRFSQAQLARVDASGAITTTCVDSLEAAAHVLADDASGSEP